MTDDRVRTENGTYVETFSPESVLDVLQQQEKPFVTTGDVADALDCSRQTARRKLSKLDDVNGDGTIRREKISGSAVVWWLPD
jgi:predicted ArsR family transcriptional regulator